MRDRDPNAISAARKISARRKKPFRELSAFELGMSVQQRRRLETQGVRDVKEGERRAPGELVSVALARCGHRSVVEVLSTGWLPRRAKCRVCRRGWQDILPLTARKPERRASRKVVAERVEVVDGREYRVQVIETPKRARFA